MKEDTADLCEEFYAGLAWCTRYYFKGYKSVSNEWYYPYTFAPDLRTLLEHSDQSQDEQLSKISYKPALKQHEALLAMMPKASKELIEPKYRKYLEEDSPMIYYYPDEFKEYSVLKRYQWECVPLLPKINLKLLRNVLY